MTASSTAESYEHVDHHLSLSLSTPAPKMSFLDRSNQDRNVLPPHTSADDLYLHPSCYRVTESLARVDPSLASTSIYGGDTTGIPTAISPVIVRPQLSIDPNIAATWEFPPETVFSASSYGPDSFEFGVNPRSLEELVTTFDGTSQTFPESQDTTLTSPRPDSPPTKKRRGRKPRALTNSSSVSVSSSAIHHTHPDSHPPSHAASPQRPRRVSATMLRAVPHPIASTTNHDDNMGPAHDDARQSQLERNRIAAAKCRSKRTAAESKLTSYEREIEDINSDLKVTHSDLRQQVLDLKDVIHSHANCDCPLIQAFLANEAKRYVESGVDAEPGNVIPGTSAQDGPSESIAA